METILYIAISSILLVAMISFGLRIVQSRAKARVISAVAFNAGLIQDRLIETARHAEGVNTGASTFGTDPGVLSLDMVDAGEDPTVFSLDADDGVFQINVASGGEVALTSSEISVTNLVFTDLTSSQDVGVVRVEFTLVGGDVAADPQNHYEESFQTTIRIPLD